jgi:hypothetical protein
MIKLKEEKCPLDSYWFCTLTAGRDGDEIKEE